jgi:nickel superoxide dismutase
MSSYTYYKFLKTLLILSFSFYTLPSLSHCQIPCGIYDDHTRVNILLEDARTINKAMKIIARYSDKSDGLSQNQKVRWILNKEIHADKMISTISSYFLTQRLSIKAKDYKERLINHHSVIIAAMKSKQNVDPKYANALILAVQNLYQYYPEHKH